MTAPPPGPSEGDPPPEGGPPPPGWPPPAQPGYPYGPYPYPPARPPSSAGLVFGLAVVGACAYFAINFMVGLAVLIMAAESTNGSAVAVAGAVVLGLIAFGGGGLFLALRKPWAKGFGLGLMTGWALTSILTVGFCTGINPTMYGNF